MTFRVGEIRIGKGNPLALIAGPCVIESEENALETAREIEKDLLQPEDPVYL